MINHLRRIIFDEETCKEIVQECFLRIFSKSIALDPNSPKTKNFILSVAKNLAVDYLRRNRMENARLKEKCYLEFPLNTNRISNQPVEIENKIFSAEISGIIKNSVRQFNALKQHVFKEVVIRGKGIADVSHKSSMSRYQVKKYYDEVVDRLKEDLAEYH